MNYQRGMAVLDNQTALAQRVFRCVPLQEWWTVYQIGNEMDRHGPHNNTKHTINGCLRALREAGLVDQQGDTYRSAVKPQPKQPKAEPMGQIDDKTAPTLVDRLINEASRLRNMADVLDGLAVEIDDEIAKATKAGSEKLRLLRELLSD